MGDLPLREPLKDEYIGGMFDLITRTANYQKRSSAIGYSFRYFASIMIGDTGKTTDKLFLIPDMLHYKIHDSSLVQYRTMRKTQV